MVSMMSQQYKKDGYTIARNLLPLDLLNQVFYDMDIVLLQQLHHLGLGHQEKPSHMLEDVYRHMGLLYANNQSIYMQVLRLWAKLFSMQALVMHPNIVKVTKELGVELPLFQTAPVVHVMANEFKITGGYHGVGVHQDWPALQSGLDTITVWFPFMDVDKNNFPVDLIPGSHTHGLFPGKTSENIYEVEPSCYNESDFVAMEVNHGDVLFMSNFTLHRTSLQGDDGRVRIACSSRYENASEKTFIERSYPSAQKRVIQRELFLPDFPKKAHLDEVYS